MDKLEMKGMIEFIIRSQLAFGGFNSDEDISVCAKSIIFSLSLLEEEGGDD